MLPRSWTKWATHAPNFNPSRPVAPFLLTLALAETTILCQEKSNNWRIVCFCINLIPRLISYVNLLVDWKSDHSCRINTSNLERGPYIRKYRKAFIPMLFHWQTWNLKWNQISRMSNSTLNFSTSSVFAWFCASFSTKYRPFNQELPPIYT